jgi:hypothetical protein
LLPQVQRVCRTSCCPYWGIHPLEPSRAIHFRKAWKCGRKNALNRLIAR